MLPRRHRATLESELGTTPVTTLVVVSDVVVNFRADPVRNLTIFSSLLGELFLDEKSLVGRLSGPNEAGTTDEDCVSISGVSLLVLFSYQGTKNDPLGTINLPFLGRARNAVRDERIGTRSLFESTHEGGQQARW